MARDVIQAGIDLIKSFEGIPDGNPATVNLDPYLDPVGIWTIGWSHALTFGNRFLRGQADRKLASSLYPGGITRSQAEDLLRVDAGEVGREVEHLVNVPLTDNQFAALVCFTFNLGAGNLQKSSLLANLNAKNYQAAADGFLKWTKAKNQRGVYVVMPGLVRRRQAERDLFLKP